MKNDNSLKKKLLEDFRIRKYDGEINSQDYLVKKEFSMDLDTAIRAQIEKRMFFYTIISTIVAVVVCIDIILRIISIL